MADEPVDYGCIGGVFPTVNKDDAEKPIGVEGLARLAAVAREITPQIPVGAIAGINETNAGEVIAAGATGIAVIGAIFSRPDPQAAAQKLRAIVDAALAARARGAAS